MQREPLRVVSVCRTLPTPLDPSGGIFIYNRLAAMARQCDLRAVQPAPYMPLVRPLPAWASVPSRDQAGLAVAHASMFYVPGVLKGLDGRWLTRAIEPILARFHAERPIDLIDAHFGYPEGEGCVRLGKRLGIPVFITVRGFETELASEPWVGPQMVSALREATGCIAVSYTLADLLGKHGIDADRVRVIHNAIDRSVFTPGEKQAARARLGLDSARPLILTVGHLVSRKRHHMLLDAFARLHRSFPDAMLAIAGSRSFESAYPDRLLRQVRSLGLDPAVRFLGNLPPRQIVDWLRAADLFVLLSAREGCCNAVLEALAVGVPCILTPAGDNARFLVAGENGYLVPIDDADAAADALANALRRADWDRSAIARRLADQVGDWDVVAGKVLDFFRERLHAPRAYAAHRSRPTATDSAACASQLRD